MWAYEKRLQYPVKITKTCPKTAQLIISQYGGPDGELSASMRYLAQRYSMPVKEVGGLLTDIGTEELAHMEIICAMVYQLTKHLTVEQAQEAGFDAYYIDHTAALWPQAAAGVPFTALEFQSKGDAIADLTEDLAAEQKARTVYDNLLRMIVTSGILMFFHVWIFYENQKSEIDRACMARWAVKFLVFRRGTSLRFLIDEMGF